MIRIATPHNNLNLTPNSQMNFNRFNPLSSDFVYGKLNVIDSTATTTAAKNLNLDHSHNHNQIQDQNQSQVSTRNIAKTLPSHEPPLLMNSNSGNADLGDWGIDEDYTPTVAATTFSGFLSPTTSSLSSTTGHQHPHAQTNANANANNNNNASSNTNAISHSQSHLNTLLTNLPAELLRHPQQFYQTQQLQHTYYNTPKQPITRQLSLQYLNGRNPLEDEPYLPPHPQYITNGKRRNSTSLSSSLKFHHYSYQQQQQQQQPKSKKQRKPQTQEEYNHQLQLWQKTGPQINTETWLYENMDNLNVDNKADRTKALHACEKAYYERDWTKCLQMCKVAELLFGVDFGELEAEEEALLQQFKDVKKKSRICSKLEKQVYELWNIKLRCIMRAKQRDKDKEEA